MIGEYYLAPVVNDQHRFNTATVILLEINFLFYIVSLSPVY